MKRPEVTGDTGSLPDKLLVAWENVTSSLSGFADTLRTLKDCDNITITLCIRNGSCVDTYSIPGKSLNEGSDAPAMELDGDHCTMTNPSCKAQPDPLLHEITDYLENCNIKQVRLFLTMVRKRLKMKNFGWPEAAKDRFIATMKAPVPSAPGRANSGKTPLIHMLKLSVEVDDAWRICVIEALNKFQEPTKSALTSIQNSRGLMSEYECEESEKDQPMLDDDFCIFTRDEMLKVVRGLPQDNLKVTIPKNAWVPLTVLLSRISYPNAGPGIGWYIQPTPDDGNCMFSAILTTAKLRGCLPSDIDSVAKMRSFLRGELLELSRAGQGSSKYRRDWLASCLHDVDDTAVERYCYKQLEKVAETYTEADMENFLETLRVFVSNWAKMVGNEQWGGLLRAELFILATKCGAVIEVLQPCRQSFLNPEETTAVATSSTMQIKACDTRFRNRLTTLERRDLIYPHTGTMPSIDQRYTGPVIDARTDNGWVGTYPVIRVVLHNRHYMACTSKHSYPISLLDEQSAKDVSSEWFQYTDTLVEPFRSLSTEENGYYEEAVGRIQQWRDACKVSSECGRHADSIVMLTKSSELSVSMLSHLEVPGKDDAGDDCYLMSDDIISCYMELLQNRTEKLRKISTHKGSEQPPQTLFMDTWFFKALLRGPSGPASTKKRLDLRPYGMIVIPALVQGHWMLAVCYVLSGVIGVYDPFDVPRYDVFNVVKGWAEAQIPNADIIWSFHHIRESRGCKQKGSIDCGIYVCKAAECLGLNIPVRISQADICYARKRMIVEFVLQGVSNIKWPRH